MKAYCPYCRKGSTTMVFSTDNRYQMIVAFLENQTYRRLKKDPTECVKHKTVLLMKRSSFSKVHQLWRTMTRGFKASNTLQASKDPFWFYTITCFRMPYALLAAYFMLVSCLAYSSTLKMEVQHSSECQLTFNILHSIISQQAELFITTVLKTQIPQMTCSSING
jgi:hypothetical protein